MKIETFKFKSVTSTNDVAINLIKEKKKKIGCIYADIQTRGRGTRGRRWVSVHGNYPPFNEFSIINPVIISGVIEHFC